MSKTPAHGTEGRFAVIHDAITTAPLFPGILRAFHERDGRSGSAVARAAGIDASYLSRLERGDREPPRREVILALARVLLLNRREADALLGAAGYPTLALLEVGMDDPTLGAVAAVLADPEIPEANRTRFRDTVEWLAQVTQGRHNSDDVA
jgi:transcriptional regulator with XRE-family HTH domain